jgi:hypothetical protein
MDCSTQHAAALAANLSYVKVMFDDNSKEYTYLVPPTLGPMAPGDLVLVPTFTSEVLTMVEEPTDHIKAVTVVEVGPVSEMDFSELPDNVRFFVDVIDLNSYEQTSEKFNGLVKEISKIRNTSIASQVLDALGIDSKQLESLEYFQS